MEWKIYSIPLHSIPLCSIPLRSIPSRSINPNGAKMIQGENNPCQHKTEATINKHQHKENKSPTPNRSQHQTKTTTVAQTKQTKEQTPTLIHNFFKK
jgi:hypothetical protein